MQRVVQPEILDALSHDDPRALANRRDLRRLNAIMGNTRWFKRRIFSQLQPDDVVLELGAGEGVLGKRCAAQRPDVRRYVAIDHAPAPTDWPPHYEWRRVDCLSLPDFNEASVICGNMILHQFDDAALRELGAKVEASAVRMLALVEPARYAMHLWQFRLLHPLLCEVSKHDGAVSIRAGFRAAELPHLLGLGEQWRIDTQSTWLGAYRLVAKRERRT